MPQIAKKGDWCRIHSIVLTADERTGKLPKDTQKCDLQMWTKGFLQDESAQVGDEVTVVTTTDRQSKGTLVEVNPYYTHGYGKCIPEIMLIEKQLKEIMYGRNG